MGGDSIIIQIKKIFAARYSGAGAGGGAAVPPPDATSRKNKDLICFNQLTSTWQSTEDSHFFLNHSQCEILALFKRALSPPLCKHTSHYITEFSGVTHAIGFKK